MGTWQTWFSKHKVRLPVGSGLYIGIFHNSSNTGIGLTMYGHTTVYKKSCIAINMGNTLGCESMFFFSFIYIYIYIYSKTCLQRNLKGPEHFSAKARFPFNQGTLHTV